ARVLEHDGSGLQIESPQLLQRTAAGAHTGRARPLEFLMRLRDARHFPRPLTILVGSLLAIGAGFAFLRYPFGEPLTRASYDVPFLWRANLDTHEIVLVYLDEESAKQLHQPIDHL